jgi:alginate O-acetyltransferase complex protein AlgI
MTLVPAVYLTILAAVVCLYWALPHTYKTGRALLLVSASSIVVFLISPTAFVVACCTALLSSYVSERLAVRPSRFLFVAAIAAVIAILAASRLSPYLDDTNNLLDLTGSAFFSLKAIAILSDAYRFSRTTRPLSALLLILFFPIYEAGPIEQPQALNRLKCEAAFDIEFFLAGVGRILVGLAKQSYLGPVLIGGLEERFSPWNQTAEASGDPLLLVLWILLKWVQIYLMFSGYSDVAIGASKLFGIRIRENFNFPFLAKNLQDFWKRWHISLIDFMSAYVYQPFVRKTGWRYRGIILLFLLTGLWHAFNVQYLLWGVLHGTVMASMARWRREEIGQRFEQWVGSHKLRAFIADGLSRIATIIFIAWVSAIGGAETWEKSLYILSFGSVR